MVIVHMLRKDVHANQLGELPSFINDNDPRSAREQLDANYQHGGGWHPVPGFKLAPNFVLHFPEDPPYEPLAVMRLREERVFVYEFSFVAIVQADGSFEVARLD